MPYLDERVLRPVLDVNPDNDIPLEVPLGRVPYSILSDLLVVSSEIAVFLVGPCACSKITEKY